MVSYFTSIFFLFSLLFVDLKAAVPNIQIAVKNDFSSYKEEKAGEFDSSDLKTYKATNGNVIRMRAVELKSKTQNQMESAFKKAIVQYTLLFQDRASPYTGAITVNTECSDKSSTQHKIIKEKTALMTSFETRATKNFVYGKCDGEGVEYYSKYFIVLCKKDSVLYDVRLFSKEKGDLNQFKVKCLN